MFLIITVVDLSFPVAMSSRFINCFSHLLFDLILVFDLFTIKFLVVVFIELFELVAFLFVWDSFLVLFLLFVEAIFGVSLVCTFLSFCSWLFDAAGSLFFISDDKFELLLIFYIVCFC